MHGIHVTTTSFRLPTLLQNWRLMLTSWAADGSLGAAAREALRLDGEPVQLTALISQWAAGDFSGLPPIEVVEGSVLPGAAGAYAISTGTIYLNGDWLAPASEQQVMRVLTHELGHYLDGAMNKVDSPDDEGELFAALLFSQAGGIISSASHSLVNNQGYITLADSRLEVEFAGLTGASWIRQLQVDNYDRIFSLAPGPYGNIYYAGRSDQLDLEYHAGTKFFGGYTPRGDSALFKQNNGYDMVAAIGVSQDNSIYIAGEDDGGTFYLFRYKPDGSSGLVMSIQGEINWPVGLTIGQDGSIYLTGDTFGDLDGQINSGNNDVFLIRYRSDGSKAWTKLMGGSGYDAPDAIASGNDGSIYIAGSTNSVLLPGQRQFGVGGGIDAFVSRYNSNGERLWTSVIGTDLSSSENEYASAVTVGTDGNIYVANIGAGGSFFLTKLNVQGARIWTRQLGDSYRNSRPLLTTGKDGSIYVAGKTYSELNVNGGKPNAVIVRYDQNGNQKGSQIISSTQGISELDLLSLVTGADGAIYLGGNVYGNFPGYTSLGGTNHGFIAKFDAQGDLTPYDLGTLSQHLSYGGANSGFSLQQGESKRFKLTLPEKKSEFDKFSVDSYDLFFKSSAGTNDIFLYDANNQPINNFEKVPAGSTVFVEVRNPVGATPITSFDAYLWKINGTVYDTFVGQTKEVSIKKYRKDLASSDFYDTWLISHGWNGDTARQGERVAISDSLSDGRLYNLATEINEQSGESILVDWSTAAYSPGFAGTEPKHAAAWINDVASFVTHSVVNVWSYRSNLNLIGHSLGAYLSSEIARLVSDQPATKGYKVDSIIALDPAEWIAKPYNISNNRTRVNDNWIPSSESRAAEPFKDIAKYSLALWGKLDVLRSVPPFEATGDGAGKGESARTANHSFQIDFLNNDAYANHGNIIDLYRDLIDNNPETPNRIRSFFDLRQGKNSFSQYDKKDEGKINGVGDDGKLTDQSSLKEYGYVTNLGYTYYTVAKGMDGYLAGGLAYIDFNQNSTLDPGEPSTEVALNGRIEFTLDDASLALLSGLPTPPPLILSPDSTTADTSTGLRFETLLSAPFGSKVITPLTTLVVELNRLGYSINQAVQEVNQAFGIPLDIRLTEYDPLAAVGQGDAYFRIVFSKAAAVQNLVSQITALLRGTSGLSAGPLSFKVFASIAARLTSQSVDFTQGGVILEIINTTASSASITLAPELVNVLPDVVAIIAEGQRRLGLITQTDPYQYLDEVARIQQVSQGLVAAALSLLAGNPLNPDSNLNQFSGDALDQLISNAQVLNLLPPTVAPSTFTLQEVPFNQPSSIGLGFVVGTVQAFDPEGQALSFGLESDPSQFSVLDLDGDGINAFTIDPLTGQVKVADLDDLDFERQSVFSLLATASDGAFYAAAPLTINLTDMVDEPVPVVYINDGTATFSISGNVEVGQTLLVDLVWDDPDYGVIEFYRQWQSSSDGLIWELVGNGTATFALASAEEGKQVRVQVSYTDGQGFSEAVTADAVSVPFVDDGDAAFSITGTPAVGQILTAANTAADPDGNGSFSYAWQSFNGNTWSAIGTDAATYTLSAAEEGKQVRVQVSYTDGQGFAEAVTANAVSVPFVDDGDAAFAITGTPAVGQILTATNTAADPDGNGSVSYAWQSFNGSTWSAIGTNVSSYTLSAAEEGKQVQVLVSYTDSQGFAEAVTADAVSVPCVDDGDAAFSINGTPAVGNTLTATNSSGDPDGNGAFSYSWQSSTNGTSWSPVGSNSSSYLVASADQGNQLRLVVSYTDGQAFAESVTTAGGSVPFINDGAATFSITGTPAVGQVLNASNTAADPDGNGSFSYAWQSFNGSSWDAIGTDAATYTLRAAEEGKQVRVRVTYLDAQGFSELLYTETVTVLVSNVDVNLTTVTVSEATPFVVVAVNLSAASTSPISFTPSLAAGGSGAGFATIGSDSGAAIQWFDAATSSWNSAAAGVTIGAGSTTLLLRTSITNDTLYEGIETYQFRTGAISGPVTNASGASGTVLIADDGTSTNSFDAGTYSATPNRGTADNDLPSISASAITVSEASPYAVVAFSLSTLSSLPVTFTPSLVSGTASIGVDTGSTIEWLNGATWQSANAGVTIPAGSGSGLVRTSLTNDTPYEGPETFQIATGAVSGVSNPAGVSATVTILDNGSSANTFTATSTSRFPTAGSADNDSLPIGTLSVAAVSNGSETGPTASVFRISRTGDPSASLTFNYGLSGTAIRGSDFTLPTNFNGVTGVGNLSFGPGVSSIELSIASLDDTSVDGDRSINLGLTAPERYTLATATATATIADNDLPLPTSPLITVVSTAAGEPDAGATRVVPVTLSLSSPSSSPITVGYRTSTSGSTATAGSDYTPIGDSTLTFTAGTNSKTFNLTINGDNSVESNESITLEFFNPVGATFAGASSTATSSFTILDNDSSSNLWRDASAASAPAALYGNPFNDTLIGGGGNDIISGDLSGATTGGADRITGNGGADNLTGGKGADLFCYPLFSDSTLNSLDTIVDFKPTDGDRIGLAALPSSLWSSGLTMPSSPTLVAAVNLVFADKDSGSAGNQSLAGSEAVIFAFEAIPGNTLSRQWYCAVNDTNSSFSASDDLLIRLAGSQALATGNLPVATLFATI